MALPAFLVVAVVIVLPLVASVALAFTGVDLSIPKAMPFVGLANFRELFSDPVLGTVLFNTVVFVLFSVGGSVVAGLGIAALLARRFRGVRTVRVIYMLPLLISWVPIGIAWRALLDPSNGWVGGSLSASGLPTLAWLSDRHLAMPAVIATDLWVGVPFAAVLLMTAMIALPKDPAEAALVDGASRWQIFRYITVPGIRPVLTIVVLFRLVDAFRQFATIQLMTGGGPGTSTTVINFYAYQEGFVFGRLGYGAAIAILMMLMMIVATLSIYVIGRRK
jgi:multiple sugar transport system permease protein